MTLPFTAVVGFNLARRALLCTLVDPTLRGVVVSGPVGTGKSSLMRGFGAFVHAFVDRDAPFVQVPLGVTDDRLMGGVDLDASLAAGEIRASRGLLGDVDGGYLFVDDLPLLDPLSIATIVRALESESIATERDGISRSDVARFVLLATTVPTERDISFSTADRIAFLIGSEERSDDATHLLMRRVHQFNEHPEELLRDVEPTERRAAEQVTTARMLHAMVALDDAALMWIAQESQRLCVAGNRADVYAAKAARAHAALRGSMVVEEEDLQFARVTVLEPRAQNVPSESGGTSDGGDEGDKGDGDVTGDEVDKVDDENEDDENENDNHPSSHPGRELSAQRDDDSSPDDQDVSPASGNDTGVESDDGDGTNSDDTEDDEGERDEERGAENVGSGDARVEEQLLAGVDFTLPLPALAEFFASRRSAAAGSNGLEPQWQRGRHTQSVAAQARGRRIAIGATLRAAAPHQRARERDDGGNRIIVRGEDIRVKRFTKQSGTLFIFCVDASGSMAANRMREAKGAVARLLQDAYVNRDTVALIAFRGKDSEVLLPPTGSVERAKRSLDVLPTGGGTPLASALMRAYAMVELAKRRDVEQSIVVLLTDGRANVPMAENAAGMIMEVRRQHVRKELETIAAAYRRSAIRTLVIDTRQSFGATSEAVRLAEMLGGRHYYLPTLDANELAGVVKKSRAT